MGDEKCGTRTKRAGRNVPIIIIIIRGFSANTEAFFNT